ncbi:MAG TPA: cyclopropane-fatty-acyl-phospholipid synthase family protein [Gammaproteobacteria bacterium]
MSTQTASQASRVLDWTEMGLVPDNVIRLGIRRLLKERLAEIAADDCERVAMNQRQFIEMMNSAPVAPVPERANEQHYEVPAEFFDLVLGARRKYSCGYWDDDCVSLDDAELAALEQTAQRAGLKDGQTVLDLGCGWGSFSLWAAERYPNSRFTAVSNSRTQRAAIVAEADRLGLKNLTVLTRDMNDFEPNGCFDRIVSIEMFEHLRNYRAMFERVSRWLNPDGRFFMHIFCHRSAAYEFVDAGPGDWMTRFFFAGGIMPSDDLPLRFQEHLRLVDRWRWDGRHYEKTSNAWLHQMDAHKADILPILSATYGPDHALKWWMRWRIFFMACAELFGYADGQEWWVSHYLFEAYPPRTAAQIEGLVEPRGRHASVS